ncbi:MAG: BT1926 family outer membrane beta-barrel protein [Bacteroidota bacterium]
MKTILKLCCILLFGLGFAQAQDGGRSNASSSNTDYKPKKGDFTGAILFGRGNFMNNVGVPGAPVTNSNWTVFSQAPNATNINGNSNDITNIAGGEARYFIKNNIAIKLAGGFVQRNTPALQNIQTFYLSGDNVVQGNDPETPNAVWIPNYSSISEDRDTELYITIGGEYHFGSKLNRLAPYVGMNINYHYLNRKRYDPTVIFQTNTDNASSSANDNIESDVLVYDIGTRAAEVIGAGFQLTGGADYYLLPGLYMGFEVRPLTFIYARSEQLPAPGLEASIGRTSTWASFTQTHFKIGFKI